MKYCQECGSTVTHVKGDHYKCNSCEGDFYINPKGATAILLVNANGDFVFGIRAYEPGKGKLDCFGGFLDVGENFEDGAIRELEEESGLKPIDISELKYLGSVYDPYPWQGRVEHVTSVYFVAKLKDGVELNANDDIKSISTVAVNEVKKDQVAWDGMWRMIEKYRETLNTN